MGTGPRTGTGAGTAMKGADLPTALDMEALFPYLDDTMDLLNP
jgi:hypothetical protein